MRHQCCRADGIFITHEHGDHVGCALSVAARHGIPLWMSAGTWRAIEPRTQRQLRSDSQPELEFVPGSRRQESMSQLRLNLIRDQDVAAIGDLQLSPFTVPHDANEPLQLYCTDGAVSLGLLTDLGHVPPYVLRNLQTCNALLLECNHDTDLLAQSVYPPFLKRRVGGSHGHLSNMQAADALQMLMHDRLHTVVAGHLSERNNRPDLVQMALSAVLGGAAKDVLYCTPELSPWFNV